MMTAPEHYFTLREFLIVTSILAASLAALQTQYAILGFYGLGGLAGVLIAFLMSGRLRLPRWLRRPRSNPPE